MSLHRKIKEIKASLIEENFFRPKWYSIFLNPYFISRYSLLSSIRIFALGTLLSEKVLDVGCGIKPYRYLFKTQSYVGIDIAGGGHTDNKKTVDTYYDGLTIPFDNAYFDKVICTQVLEHATDPEVLIKEIGRVLKPGGKAFITMPFTYPEHEAPYDFNRFTKFKHEQLLSENGFININIEKTTGIFGTFGQLLTILGHEGITFSSTLLKTIICIIVWGPLQTISLFLDLVFYKKGITLDYVVIAEKR